MDMHRKKTLVVSSKEDYAVSIFKDILMEMRWFLYAFWMAAYSKEAAADSNIARVLWKIRIGEWLKR